MVVRPVKYSVFQSSSPQLRLTGERRSGSFRCERPLDRSPRCRPPRAIDIAFDVALHAVGMSDTRITLQIAEQALRAEVNHAVAFDIVSLDQLPVRVAVIDVENLFVRREAQPFGLTKVETTRLIVVRSRETR